MSMKVYNGVKFKAKTIEGVLKDLQSIREEAITNLGKSIADPRGNLYGTLSVLDRHTLRVIYKYKRALLEGVEREKLDYMRHSVYFYVRSALYRNGDDPTKMRDRMDLDYPFEVVVYPYRGNFYGTYYGVESCPDNLKLLLTIADEYHYQDQTDRDERITRSEWEKRKRAWNGILKTYSIPSQAGSTYTLAKYDDIRHTDVDVEKLIERIKLPEELGAIELPDEKPTEFHLFRGFVFVGDLKCIEEFEEARYRIMKEWAEASEEEKKNWVDYYFTKVDFSSPRKYYIHPQNGRITLCVSNGNEEPYNEEMELVAGDAKMKIATEFCHAAPLKHNDNTEEYKYLQEKVGVNIEEYEYTLCRVELVDKIGHGRDCTVIAGVMGFDGERTELLRPVTVTTLIPDGKRYVCECGETAISGTSDKYYYSAAKIEPATQEESARWIGAVKQFDEALHQEYLTEHNIEKDRDRYKAPNYSNIERPLISKRTC
jgi:hypothetical protein